MFFVFDLFLMFLSFDVLVSLYLDLLRNGTETGTETGTAVQPHAGGVAVYPHAGDYKKLQKKQEKLRLKK